MTAVMNARKTASESENTESECKHLVQSRATVFFGNQRWKTAVAFHHPLRRLGLSESLWGSVVSAPPHSPAFCTSHGGVISSGAQRRSQSTRVTSADSFAGNISVRREILPPNSCIALTAHLLELLANSTLTRAQLARTLCFLNV